MKIECLNLNKSYADTPVLKDINFTIESGSFFALIGSNGAGKSTLLDILIKKIKPSSGTILIDNKDITELNHTFYSSIGMVFQHHTLDQQLSVYDNLMIRAQIHFNKAEARAKTQEMLKLMQLDNLKKQKYKTLSGGQKRKLDIAAAIIHSPSLLILDEPTTGVDIQSRQEIWKVINAIHEQQHMTIILTTHYLDEAEQAERMVLLDKGQLSIQGTPSDLRAQYTKHVLTIVPKDEQQVKSYLENKNINFTISQKEISIDFASSLECLDLLEQLRTDIESYEMKKGTLEDVFNHFIKGENND